MSQELETRNRMICKQYATGKTQQEIAEDFGLSRQRVAQIIATYGANVVTDDESRSSHRMRLDHLLGKAMEIVQAGPAQAFDVKGEALIDVDGNPVMNYEGVLKAMDEARKLSDSIRRMDALDLPRRKQIAEDEAMRQAKEWLAQLPRADVQPDED